MGRNSTQQTLINRHAVLPSALFADGVQAKQPVKPAQVAPWRPRRVQEQSAQYTPMLSTSKILTLEVQSNIQSRSLKQRQQQDDDNNWMDGAWLFDSNCAPRWMRDELSSELLLAKPKVLRIVTNPTSPMSVSLHGSRSAGIERSWRGRSLSINVSGNDSDNHNRSTSVGELSINTAIGSKIDDNGRRATSASPQRNNSCKNDWWSSVGSPKSPVWGTPLEPRSPTKPVSQAVWTRMSDSHRQQRQSDHVRQLVGLLQQNDNYYAQFASSESLVEPSLSDESDIIVQARSLIPLISKEANVPIHVAITATIAAVAAPRVKGGRMGKKMRRSHW